MHGTLFVPSPESGYLPSCFVRAVWVCIKRDLGEVVEILKSASCRYFDSDRNGSGWAFVVWLVCVL